MIDPLTGQIPPPKIVVPILSSQSGPIHVHSSYDTPHSNAQTFGFFNPITPVTHSQPQQTLSQSVIAAQQTASLISSLLQPVRFNFRKKFQQVFSLLLTIFGTITFATFPTNYNFCHFRVNIHIYCKSGNSISLKLNMFIDTKVAKVIVAKVTWRKLAY
jgi:spore coat protein U-like protein